MPVFLVEYDFNITKLSDEISSGFGTTYVPLSVCFGHLNPMTKPSIVFHQVGRIALASVILARNAKHDHALGFDNTL